MKRRLGDVVRWMISRTACIAFPLSTQGVRTLGSTRNPKFITHQPTTNSQQPSISHSHEHKTSSRYNHQSPQQQKTKEPEKKSKHHGEIDAGCHPTSLGNLPQIPLLQSAISATATVETSSASSPFVNSHNMQRQRTK